MNSLDPTYLRYIFDGLFKGEFSLDNESSLPDGLVGLYENAFNESIPINKRQTNLIYFATWSLLKKEVSIRFIAEIFEINEDEIEELIRTFSPWFNRTESNKFTLYHQRIRIYFLQKLNEGELRKLQYRLIERLEIAIQEKKEDEFEIYALQFLSDHYLEGTIISKLYEQKLISFSKNEIIWKRQIELSNKFEWSRKGIINTALWFNQTNKKEAIFSYIDLVELAEKETNDTVNIIQLIASNQIDLALERITAIGSESKDSKERQFLLYLLALIELTFLESKNKSWTKNAIEKILIHLDQEIPNDSSLVNWNDFFSSFILFLIVFELEKLKLKSSILYSRTEFWDHEWLTDFKLDSSEVAILLEASEYIQIKFKKNQILTSLSLNRISNGDIEFAKEIIEKIENSNLKSKSLNAIAISLIKNEKINEALEICHYIEDQEVRSQTKLEIATILVELNKINQAIEVLLNHVFEVDLIKVDWKISYAYKHIAIKLAELNKIEESLNIVNKINSISDKSSAYIQILPFTPNDKTLKNNILNNIFTLIKQIENQHHKDVVVEEICEYYIQTNQINKIEEYIKQIHDTKKQKSVLNKITLQVENLFSSIEIIEKSKTILGEIDTIEYLQNHIENLISKDFNGLNELVDFTFKLISKINDLKKKSQFLIKQFQTLKEYTIEHLGKIKDEFSTLLETINYSKNESLINDLTNDLLIAKEVELSLLVIDKISINYLSKFFLIEVTKLINNPLELFHVSNIIKKLVSFQFESQNVNDQENTLYLFFDQYIKSQNYTKAIDLIPHFHLEQNKFKSILIFIEQNLRNVNQSNLINGSINNYIINLNDENLKNSLMLKMAEWNYSINQKLEAEKIINKIESKLSESRDKLYQLKILSEIFILFIKQNEISKVKLIESKINKISENISNEQEKDNAFKSVTIDLVKAGYFSKSIEYAKKINNPLFQSEVYYLISIELANSNSNKKIISIVNEIVNQRYRNIALKEIALIYQEKGLHKEFEKYIELALEESLSIYSDYQTSNFKDNDHLNSAALKVICEILILTGRIEDVKLYLEKIKIISIKNAVCSEIALFLIKNKNENDAVSFIKKELTEIEQKLFWEKVGKTDYHQKGLTFCSENNFIISNKDIDIRLNYMKGVFEKANFMELNFDLLFQFTHLNINKLEPFKSTLSLLILKHIFSNVELSNFEHEKINNILRMKWAIDLKNQLQP